MAQFKFIRKYDEVENIKTFIFENTGKSWKPGQYQASELKKAGSDEKERIRYFTFASAPSEGEIHITTRISNSAFKKALNALKAGDAIEADGIDGEFFWEDDAPVILVAGGIGVTPYRSMILERTAKKQNYLHIWPRTYGRISRQRFAKKWISYKTRLVPGLY